MSPPSAFPLPHFQTQGLERIFSEDLRIPLSYLEQLLQEPRQPLLDDLQLILASLPEWIGHFDRAQAGATAALPGNRTFPIHTLSLLEALRATPALPQILQTLRLPADQLHFWFGDFTTGSLWEILFHLTPANFTAIRSYLREADNAPQARLAALATMAQWAWHRPIHRSEVMAWFRELLEEIISGALPSNASFNAQLVRRIVDLRATEFLPLIEQLYAQQPVDARIAGEWSRVQIDIHGPVNSLAKRKIYTWRERYEFMVATLYPSTPEDRSTAVRLSNKASRQARTSGRRISSNRSGTFQRNVPKVGRNDPCPCGSGKKYKKCHGK